MRNPVRQGTPGGFSLIELMLAMLLGSFLLLGMIQAFAASSAAARVLQQRYAVLQDGERASRFILAAAREAGYPRLGNNLVEFDFPAAVGALSRRDGDNDILVLEGWSRQNCFATGNPARDSQGEPRLYFRRQRFSLSGNSLRWHCGYGPDPDNLVTQINNQSLVDRLDGFQVLYHLDSDRDGNIDHSVGGEWEDSRDILGLEIRLRFSVSGRQREFGGVVRLRGHA